MKNKALSAVLSVIIIVVQVVTMLSAAAIFIADNYISKESIIKQTEKLDLSPLLGGEPTAPLVTEFSEKAKSSAEVVLEQAISFDVIQDYWTLPLGSGTPSWRVIINVTGEKARAATDYAKSTLAEQLKIKSIYQSKDELTDGFAEAYAAYAFEKGYIKSSDRVSCKAEVDKHFGYYLETLDETALATPVSFGSGTLFFSVTGERGPAFQNYVADMLNNARNLAARSYLTGFVGYIKYGEETPLVDSAAVKDYLMTRMNEASQLYGFSLSEADKETLSEQFDSFVEGKLVKEISGSFPEHSVLDSYIGAEVLSLIRIAFKPAVKWALVAFSAVLALLCVLVWKKKRVAVFFESAAFILTAAALGVVYFFIRGVDLTELLACVTVAAGADASKVASGFVRGFAGSFISVGFLFAAVGVLLLLAALAVGKGKKPAIKVSEQKTDAPTVVGAAAEVLEPKEPTTEEKPTDEVAENKETE